MDIILSIVQCGAARWLGLWFVMLGVVASGCSFPSLPPPLSAAKFVRPSTGTETGKLGVSTGLLIFDDGDDTNLYMFPGEGALSIWLSPNYDLAVTAGNLLASAEGNFVVLQDPVRLGLLHGLGFSVFDTSGGTNRPRETTFVLDLTGGVFVQYPLLESGDLFGALKYTYATNVEDEDRDRLKATHYVTGSVGYLLPVGPLMLSPEVIVTHGIWTPRENADSESFSMVLVAVTASVGY